MTIAVFGATGHYGALVIDHLLARGVAPADIRAIGRDAAKLAPYGERGVGTAVADYDDAASLATAVAGTEKVLLVSGTKMGHRVQQHSAVISAAKDAGASLVVYTSAPHADTTDFVLAAEHRGTEEALRASGVPFTILRNNWYTENYRGDVDGARETGVIRHAFGDARIASAPRSEYAEAAAVVLTGAGYENAVLELSGDTAWTFTEFAAAAAAALGREVTYVAQTSDEVAAQLAAGGADEGTISFVTAMNAGIAGGALADATATLRDLLGRPTEPMPTTIASWVDA